MMPGIEKSKKILFAPLNWGLGHATRDLPLIRYFMAKYFRQQGWCYSVSQQECNLVSDVKQAEKYSGFLKNYSNSSENIEKLYREEFRKKLFI